HRPSSWKIAASHFPRARPVPPRVKVLRGAAQAELVENGWRQFLVKVHNEAGGTARVEAQSSNAQRLAGSTSGPVPDTSVDPMMFDQPPLVDRLNGLKLEYRIIHLYSRDVGKREAKISFNVGQGTQDLGFRNELPVLFDCKQAQPLTLHVQDENSQPTSGAF